MVFLKFKNNSFSNKSIFQFPNNLNFLLKNSINDNLILIPLIFKNNKIIKIFHFNFQIIRNIKLNKLFIKIFYKLIFLFYK